MDLAVVVLTFGAIFVVELPDKTFIATLVLATKYPPFLVWLGVSAAFAVQTAIAVTLGKAVGLLPGTAVQSMALVLFLVGAVILFREGHSHQQASGEEFAERAGEVHGFRVVVTSFLVLFAAEWGDLSQLLVVSLVAKYDAPVSVFVGAFIALVTVGGIAALAGRTLMRWVPLYALHYFGAAVCLALAGLTAYELLA
jgi:putative Ca2+/H+ antiporter (TMEM165/GDT1 family)